MLGFHLNSIEFTFIGMFPIRYSFKLKVLKSRTRTTKKLLVSYEYCGQVLYFYFFMAVQPSSTHGTYFPSERPMKLNTTSHLTAKKDIGGATENMSSQSRRDRFKTLRCILFKHFFYNFHPFEVRLCKRSF